MQPAAMSKSPMGKSLDPQLSVMSQGVNTQADGSQYLTFFMAGEEYGVDILCVQEIRGWDSATPLPNAPSYIKGVINLRGVIVPIVDLRQCFGLPATEYGPITVVIVLKLENAEHQRVVGMVVDAVSDVYSLSTDQMRAPPDLGEAVDTSFIKGLVTVNEKMVILLQLESLLGSNQFHVPDSKALSSVKELH